MSSGRLGSGTKTPAWDEDEAPASVPSATSSLLHPGGPAGEQQRCPDSPLPCEMQKQIRFDNERADLLALVGARPPELICQRAYVDAAVLENPDRK